MRKDIVCKPWDRRELKEIVWYFSMVARKKKLKWLEEWDSVCTIYSPHLPGLMQLKKLTLPSDLTKKVIDICKIPCSPTEFSHHIRASIWFYGIIALAVLKEVVKQVNLVRIRQGKDDDP